MTRNRLSAPPRPAPRVLICDVNETLLDLQPLKRRVDRVLQTDEGSNLWFASMLQRSLAMTVSDEFASPTEIGVAALQMVARSRNIEVSAAAAHEIVGLMRALPAHPDVAPALDRLREAGFRLAALSNLPTAALEAQLVHAGLAGRFECRLSAESMRRLKPYRRVYQGACKEMQAEPHECMLVAAHGWHVTGARRAGLQTAFVERPGQCRFALDEPPDLTVADFTALADGLAGDRQRSSEGGDTVPAELLGS